MRKLRTVTGLTCKSGMQVWKTYDDNVHINKVWDSNTETIKISAQEHLNHYE
jgi:hypothetical protein